MKHEKGERIGAVFKSSETTISLIGFGTYVGDEVPPEDPTGKRGLMALVHEVGHVNPKLVMDDGRVIWGCECWWGSEEAVKEMIGNRKVIELNNYPQSRE